jgi:hypothetical protein
MKKPTALEIITEAVNTGSCYIGSYEPEFALQTEKKIESIERYIYRAKIYNLRNEYKTVGTDCYMVIK